MDNNDIRNPRLQMTIRMSRSAMSFAVGDPKTDGNIVYEPYELNGSISLSANLREAFDSVELLRSGYKNALLLTDSTVMLVPQEEYVEGKAPSLYRYTIGGHEKDDIARAELPELNAIAVFAVSHDVRVVLQDHFENVNILPVISFPCGAVNLGGSLPESRQCICSAAALPKARRSLLNDVRRGV